MDDNAAIFPCEALRMTFCKAITIMSHDSAVQLFRGSELGKLSCGK